MPSAEAPAAANSSSKLECARRFEELLFHLPNYQITLDRLLLEYERYYGAKLPNYCGHSKLLNLLEELKDTIEISGSGPQRNISLHPLRLYACEIRELLKEHPKGLEFPLVVPKYKEKYKKDMLLDILGKSKLISALEAIPDVVKITGSGPKRCAHLQGPTSSGLGTLQGPTSSGLGTLQGPTSSALGRIQSPTERTKLRKQFADEVASLMQQQQLQKTTLENLSVLYYSTYKKLANFRLLGYSSMVEALKEVPNIVITGSSNNPNIELTGATGPAPLYRTPSPMGSPTPRNSDSATTCSDTSTPKKKSRSNKIVAPPCRFVEKIRLRLVSEMHRLLMCHPEHAMTLTELCEEFRNTDDPACPSEQDLHACAVKTVYSADKPKSGNHSLVVSGETQGMVIISLRVQDALWKLVKDLTYLFVYRPCHDFTMTSDELLAVYQECYGHRLNVLVYNSKTFVKLLKNKYVSNHIQYEEEANSISLLLKARYEVFLQLACELLFRKGPECRSLPLFVKCYEEYFKTKLYLDQLRVDSLEELIGLPEVAPFVKIDGPRLSLTSRGLYAEQLRYLLTVHGQLFQELLPTIYNTVFRKPDDPSILGWLHQKPIRFAGHVVHLAAESLIVWAPTGRPYPDTRSEEQDRNEPPEEHGIAEFGEIPTVEEIYKQIEELPTELQDLPPVESITLDFMDEDMLRRLATPILPSTPLVGEVGTKSENGESSSLVTNNLDFNPFPTLPPHPLASNHVTNAPPDHMTVTSSSINSHVTVTSPSHMTVMPSSHVTESKSVDSSHVTGHMTNDIPSGAASSLVGLDTGEFAGMRPEEVLEEMKGLRYKDGDSRSKIESLGSFLEYFGELSARELERVEGPPKPKSDRTKGRRKHELAIRFPGQPTTPSYTSSDDVISASLSKMSMSTAPSSNSGQDTEQEVIGGSSAGLRLPGAPGGEEDETRKYTE